MLNFLKYMLLFITNKYTCERNNGKDWRIILIGTPLKKLKIKRMSQVIDGAYLSLLAI